MKLLAGFFIIICVSLSNVLTQITVPEVGEVEYEFSIENGEANIKIPIPLLKGVNNFQPALSLSYKSSRINVNSEIGINWFLSGLSEINRCFKTIGVDGMFEKINFNANDKYCLDGNRLVLVSKGTLEGKSYFEYRTEIDSNDRIVAYNITDNYGPQYFKVYTKDNNILTYGSALKYNNMRWVLTRREDYLGNRIDYFYNLSNIYYAKLEKIVYANKLIQFEYEERNDPIRKHYDSKVIIEITDRLKSIVLKSNETLNKRIELKYSEFGNGKLSLLKEVNVCFGDHGVSTCIKPLKFNYDNDKTIEKFSNMKVFDEICGKEVACDYQIGDVNGDGLNDIVAIGDNGIYVSLNNISEFAPAKLWTSEFSKSSGWDKKIDLISLIDINNDRFPDIVGISAKGIYVALNAKGTIQAKEKWTTSYAYLGKIYSLTSFADLNNDGFVDIYSVSRDYVRIVYNLNGQGFENRLGVIKILNEYKAFFIEDFNADATPEFVFLMNTVNKNGFFHALRNESVAIPVNKSFIVSESHYFLNPAKFVRMFADINNDNLPDLLGITNNQILLGLTSVGNTLGNHGTLVINNADKFNFMDANYKYQMLDDLNGDGFLDVVLFSCNGIYVSFGNGTGFSTPPTPWSELPSPCPKSPLDTANPRFLIDMNGDGMSDVVAFQNNMLKVLYNLNGNVRMSNFIDSKENKIAINYESLVNIIKHSSHSIDYEEINNKDYSTYAVNKQIVISTSKMNSLSGSGKITEYTYGTYVCNVMSGRQACQFKWIESKDTNSEFRRRTEFHSSLPLTGYIKSETLFNKNILLQSEQKDYKVVEKSSDLDLLAIKKITLTSSTTNYFEAMNGVPMYSKQLNFKYDEYENVKQKTEITTDKASSSSHVKTTNYVIKNDITTWFLGDLVETEEITTLSDAKGATKVIKTNEYTNDSKTRQLKRKLKNARDRELALEETYKYDSFGNVIQILSAPYGTSYSTRKQLFTFDKFGINKIISENALGHKEFYDYDHNDNLIRLVDANNLTTEIKYDRLGRKILEKMADQIESSWTYTWDDQDRGITRLTRKRNNNIIEEIKVFDSFGRVIRVITIGFDGEEVFEDFIFNSKGLLEKRSLKYNGHSDKKPNFISMEYDDLDREIARHQPSSFLFEYKTLRTEYNGFKKVETDNFGFTKTEERNYLNQIIKIEDSIGSTASYRYDPMGNLIEITDPSDSKTVFEYDANGAKILFNEPSFGIIRYQYNAFGELQSQSDSNGKITTFEMDVLGRVVRRFEEEGQTEWIYDQSKYGKGKLSKTIAVNYSTELVYDSFSREIDSIRHSFGEVFSTKTSYDMLGRIRKITHPNDFVIYYCYNYYGFLNKITRAADCTGSYIWQADEYDANGHLTQEKYGNKITQNYAYDQAFLLKRITSKTNDGKIFRKLDYFYDINRNLIKRIDYEKDGTLLSMDKFTYDPLDRLTSSTTYSLKSHMPKIEESKSFVYDEMGNIQSYEDSSQQNRIYEYDLAKTQQAIRIGNNKLDYDSMGNVIKTNAYSIEWYSFLKAKIIQTNTSKIEYKYNPLHERVVKDVDNGRQVTHYVADTYEKIIEKETNNQLVISHKYYIKLNDRILATHIERKNTPPTTLYIHSDVTGSTDAITDERGALLVRYKYEAFGQRKTTYQNASSSSAVLLLLNRGFTGHEYIDDNRLINMNGRIFDAVFLRFLSPDLNVQDHFNIQNLNRYSYCLNNPFKYKDPTGYFLKGLFQAFSIILTIMTSGFLTPFTLPVSMMQAITNGAMIGAGTGFVSGFLFSGGNLKIALKSALIGAVTGSVANGLIHKLGIENLNALTLKNSFRFSYETISNGIINTLDNRPFFDGFKTRAFSVIATQFYTQFTKFYKEGAVFKPGGPASEKYYQERPVEGANNVGFQGDEANKMNRVGYVSNSKMRPWHEGGPYSILANKIPIINAAAGVHDTINYLFPAIRENTLGNALGMIPAYLISATSLYHQVALQCPYCLSETENNNNFDN